MNLMEAAAIAIVFFLFVISWVLCDIAYYLRQISRKP